MDYPEGAMQVWAARSYERLIRLYPPRFRRQFSAEIYEIFLERLETAGNAHERSGIVLREMIALFIAILQERWHEWRTRKGAGMDPENRIRHNGSGEAILQVASVPANGEQWVGMWILLNLFVYPLAFFTISIFGIPYQWILSPGAQAGLWPAAPLHELEACGFVTGLALGIATVQWWMVRKNLPRAGIWFTATAVSIWLAGMAMIGLADKGILSGATPDWAVAAMLVAAGSLLGLAQWLVLRRLLQNAGWIIAIDLIAFIPYMFLRDSFTGPLILLVLAWPGCVTGLGLWLLLRLFRPAQPVYHKPPHRIGQNWPRSIQTGSKWGALVAILFFVLWAYASSQLALAKTQGVYQTVEQALSTMHNNGYREDAQLMYFDVKVSPINENNRLSHVVWGGITATYDRIPTGHRWTTLETGSTFIHTRDGWVLLPESLSIFPEFTGWLMELYNLEGVRQFHRSGNS